MDEIKKMIADLYFKSFDLGVDIRSIYIDIPPTIIIGSDFSDFIAVDYSPCSKKEKAPE